MELWLVVGALVLIALTVWIVWPAQRPVEDETSAREEQPTMSTNLTPQGDRFEDQYTSATADLSAGGVATTPRVEVTTTADGEPPAWLAPEAQPQRGMRLTEPRTMGTGMALVLMIGGGIAGAWLYARWQRERNRPINRLRRGARDLADRMSQRMPEMDELPAGAAPAGGAATALALTSVLVLSRVLRRRESVQEGAESSHDVISDRLEQGRQRARQMRMWQLRDRMPEIRRRRPEMRDVPAKPAMLGGVGVGGTAMLIGAAWLIWRLLRGGPSTPEQMYITDRMGE